MAIISKGGLLLTAILYLLNTCSGQSCRYQYRKQPTTSITCNPYRNQRLIIDCQMTYPISEQSVVIRWIFVPDSAGSARTLATDGIKYTITTNPSTGSTISSLTVSSLGNSDVGRYYCQGGFSNGTLLARSEDLTLFSQAVFDVQNLASCSTSSGQSDLRTTCVLMAGQVAIGSTGSDQTGGDSNNNVGGTNTGGGGGGGGSGGLADTEVIIIAVVVSAVVLFILLAISLVTCLLLCNCACESYNYGVK